MYCPTCGLAVAQGLNYCNHCGAKLNGNRDDSLNKSSAVRPESLIQSMVSLFVIGLMAIMGLMTVMKLVLGLNEGLIIAFTVLSFVVMLTIEAVFIRLLMRRTRGIEKTSDTAPSREQPTKGLDAVEASVLPEARPSVTEHTTRGLEPIQSDRKAR